METPAAKRVYTGQFVRLCLSNFLFFASFNMIIPELPAYLRSMGGEKYLGLIIALFTLTAGGARPFSGKWADRMGRIPVMIIGAVVSAVCGLLYAYVLGVFSFLLLRFLHGFSTGFLPTGTTAYVADIVPANKRGESMGLISLSGSLGMAAGPALGSYIAARMGLNPMFYASSITGVLAVGMVAGMKETVKHREKFSLEMLRIRRNEVFEPRVLAPAFVLLLSCVSFGTMLTLVPDISEHLQMENKGIFFLFFTLSSVLVRFSAGRISDRIGREKVLLISTFTLAVAMVMIGTAASPAALLAGAVVFGLAQGINSPTVFAWAIDRSDEHHIGRAMATVYISLEIGIGLGAFFAGSVYRNEISHVPYIFGVAAFCALFAFTFLIRLLKRK